MSMFLINHKSIICSFIILVLSLSGCAEQKDENITKSDLSRMICQINIYNIKKKDAGTNVKYNYVLQLSCSTNDIDKEMNLENLDAYFGKSESYLNKYTLREDSELLDTNDSLEGRIKGIYHNDEYHYETRTFYYFYCGNEDLHLQKNEKNKIHYVVKYNDCEVNITNDVVGGDTEYSNWTWDGQYKYDKSE